MTDIDTYIPCPSLEKDLHGIGCKTETIEVCGFRVVMIKVPDEVVSSD